MENRPRSLRAGWEERYFFGITIESAAAAAPRFSARFSLIDFDGFFTFFFEVFSPMAFPFFARSERRRYFDHTPIPSQFPQLALPCLDWKVLKSKETERAHTL